MTYLLPLLLVVAALSPAAAVHALVLASILGLGVLGAKVTDRA